MLLSQIFRSRGRIVRRWILPSLAARILVPLGFMPGNVFAGEFLLPCPSAMPASVFQLGLERMGSESRAHQTTASHLGHAGHEHHFAGSTATASSGDADLVGSERQCPIGSALSADIHSSTSSYIAVPPSLPPGTAITSSALTLNQVFARYYARAPPVSAS
ncbi:MAG: hypothetical protein AAF098_11805 [Pseudomonadota bacterium]